MRNIYTLIFLCISQIINAQTYYIQDDTTHCSQIELGEIIISGSKNDMKLKQMPSSVTLLTETSILNGNIKSLTDITSISPSLFMPYYGSKLTSPIYIRGIGSRINAPAVGLYVDDVPFFDKSSFMFDFYDIERIEILKGPQGTLYGRNTIGGVINIKTLSPKKFQGIKALVGGGSYGLYEANAGLYHKFNNKMAASITSHYNRHDGFYTNELTKKQVDKSETVGLRSKIIWSPSSKLTFENTSSYENSDEGAYPYSSYDSIRKKATPIRHNHPGSYERSMLSNALTSRYKTNDIELQLVGAIQLIDDNQNIDQDFSEKEFYFVNQKQNQILYSEELIIKSVNKSTYNWLFGAMGFMQNFNKTVDVNIVIAHKELIKRYDHSICGAALFHQSKLSLNNLTLTGGIRIDFEKDNQDYRAKSVANQVEHPIGDKEKTFRFFEILPKFGANYQFNGTNMFLSIARGYKTGGFNSSFDKNRPQDMTYNSEYSMNYEVGTKTSLINQQLYADIGLYYIDWSNQQIYQTNPSGIGSRLTNAGRSTSWGVESTIKTVPICGHVTSLSYGYNHATFKSYKTSENLNYNGNFIPYAPQHTLSFRISKAYILNKIKLLDKIRINLTYSGLGKTYWNEENTTYQNFYQLLSTKVSFIKNEFALNFWMNNILDSKYHAFAFQTSMGTYVQNGQPINFGVSLSYNL